MRVTLRWSAGLAALGLAFGAFAALAGGAAPTAREAQLFFSPG